MLIKKMVYFTFKSWHKSIKFLSASNIFCHTFAFLSANIMLYQFTEYYITNANTVLVLILFLCDVAGSLTKALWHADKALQPVVDWLT